ncbi:AfsR/SARP family transcriptional regulator [Kitasatospora sp. McL0602]|uniref:AfsR/SARP family transcriptional regulator n=1 Tax=Kitasatospora sp. McL0602 TaxID=3439530 RepID=UPI003F8BD522
MASDRVEFGVLGPLSVTVGGEVRTLGSALQRNLLAALLLKANQVVSVETLVSVVWEENPPEAPRQALNNHIMRLRKALGPVAAERIRTRAPGLLIEVRPGELDTETFIGLYRRARSATADRDWHVAGEDTRAALALWRGPALLDIPSEQLHHEHCEALVALRFQTEQLQIDCDLHLGRFAEAAARVHGLRIEHPWHERLVAQQVIALCSSGEQTKALGIYRSFRDQLADELGLEPGRELHLLQQGVLQQAATAQLLSLVTGEPSTVDRVAGLPEQIEPPALSMAVGSPAPTDPQPVGTEPVGTEVAGTEAVGTEVAGTEAAGPVRKRWRGIPQFVRTALVSVLACALAVGAVVSFGGSGAKSSPTTPATSAAPADQQVSLRTASPDGQVRYRGRIAFDDQILTTSGVNVPVLARTRRGDVVLVALTLTATTAGQVAVKDTAGNTYTMVGDIVDTYWHRTMLFAAFNAKQLDTADQISASYPKASKYHLAADVFSGVSAATGQAGGSNVYDHNTTAFSTSAAPLTCTAGDLLVSVVATNTGPKPQFSADWQALPELRLSSYRQTTAYRFVTTTEKCAATGTTTAQWEALAVLLHR